jgi:hypothetical protein
MTTPLPTTLCDHCLQQALDGLEDDEHGLAVIYCAHETTGAIYEQWLGLWRTFSPITRDKFAQFIEREFMARAAMAKLNRECDA